MTRARDLERSLGAVLACLLAAGCPADDDDTGASTSDAESSSVGSDPDSSSSSPESESSSTGAPAVDYATMVQPIWNAACTCHLQGPSGTMTATVLTLNEDVSYAN